MRKNSQSVSSETERLNYCRRHLQFQIRRGLDAKTKAEKIALFKEWESVSPLFAKEVIAVLKNPDIANRILNWTFE